MSKIWTPEDIKKFEKQYNVECRLREDGKYDVCGDIYCSESIIADTIPSIVILYGNFRASHIPDLISLEGSPSIITRSFNCRGCNLLSLEGIPDIIHDNFDCRDNPNLAFNKADLDKLNFIINGKLICDPWQLIYEDPSEFIEKGILPI